MSVVALSYGGYTPFPTGTSLAELAGAALFGNTLADFLSVNPGLLADTVIGRQTPFHYLIFNTVPTGVGGEDFVPAVIDTALLESFQTLPGYSAQANAYYHNSANSLAHLHAANLGVSSDEIPIHTQVGSLTAYQPYLAPPPPNNPGAPVHTALRLFQRNDGLGPSGHARIITSSVPNGASSTQLQRPPRVGTTNLIDPGPNVEGGSQ